MKDLPKKYNRRESKVDGKVLAWFMENYPRSFAIEVKVTGGKVKDHQAAALNQVVGNKFGWKIPDTGRKNSFDLLGLKDADAFICVCEGNDCVCTRLNDGEVIHMNVG